MPPQTRAAARGGAPNLLAALPLPLALRIFALLPADARLLAAAVCHSWRAMLAERSLWTRLDLSKSSAAAALPWSGRGSRTGVASPSDALLRAAAARAGGQLEALRVSLQFRQPHAELLAVLAANAATVRELALCTADNHDPPSSEAVAALLHAAPGLRLLEAGVHCEGAAALPVVRKEPPFGPLRLVRIYLKNVMDADWPAVADGLRVHVTLETVGICVWPESQVDRDSVVGAMLSLPLLRSLTLSYTPTTLLARLLGCAALNSLQLIGVSQPLLDSPASAALLSDALRANSRLKFLVLYNVDFWHDMDAATTLLSTLQTHPSLTHFMLMRNAVLPEHAKDAGAALGALIAHSPKLTTLSISNCALGDVGLRTCVDALPRARQLRGLGIKGNNMSAGFARKHLLPAVRACATLRHLDTGDAIAPGSRTAARLVQQRR